MTDTSHQAAAGAAHQETETASPVDIALRELHELLRQNSLATYRLRSTIKAFAIAAGDGASAFQRQLVEDDYFAAALFESIEKLLPDENAELDLGELVYAKAVEAVEAAESVQSAALPSASPTVTATTNSRRARRESLEGSAA